MTSRNWRRCSAGSWSSGHRHRSSGTSICAPTRVTPARRPAHGYIPHVKGRGQEATEIHHDPNKRARRLVVEVAHSWFNRFRKLYQAYWPKQPPPCS